MSAWRRWPLTRSDLAWLLLVVTGLATLWPLEAVRVAAVAVLVGVLVAVPVLRVCGLAVGWWRHGDRRYAWIGGCLALVCVIGVATGVMLS